MTTNSYAVPSYDPGLLQQAADYRAVKKSLRSAGIFSAVNGLIFTIISLNVLTRNPFAVLLLLIGMLMIAESICTFIGPSPVLFIIDGIAIGSIGVLFMGGTLLAIVLHHTRHIFPILGILGLFQILAAFNDFKRYQRFARTPMQEPPREIYNYIDAVAQEIGKMDPKGRTDVIQVVSTTFPVQTWKVHLTEGRAIFVDPRNHEVLFVQSPDVDLQTNATSASGTKAQLRIRDRWLPVMLPAESLQRFAQWKANAQLTSTPHLINT